MNLSCVIVDDEYLAINVLAEYASHIAGLTVLRTFKNPKEALEYLTKSTPDILFLDIQMPYLSGFDLLSRLNEPPLIVFTTARHDYAVQAFELDVLDYLVKPISFDRFLKAVTRAEEYRLYLQHKASVTTNALEHIMIRADYRIYKIMIDQIEYIEGLSEYVRIYTRDKMYITYAALKDLQTQLPEVQFTRIHKRFIVSRNCVESYNQSRIIFRSGKEFPIGRTYKDAVVKWLTGN